MRNKAKKGKGFDVKGSGKSLTNFEQGGYTIKRVF